MCGGSHQPFNLSRLGSVIIATTPCFLLIERATIFLRLLRQRVLRVFSMARTKQTAHKQLKTKAKNKGAGKKPTKTFKYKAGTVALRQIRYEQKQTDFALRCVAGSPNVSISRFPDFQISRFQNFRMCETPGWWGVAARRRSNASLQAGRRGVGAG